MIKTPSIACFGAAHWDTIGQALPGFNGPDRPGSVEHRPGGVAANVAVALAARNMRVELFSVLGRDGEGDALLTALRSAGVGTDWTLIRENEKTGRYVAVEDASGELISAVADCRAVENLTVGSFDTRAAVDMTYWFLETNLPEPVIADLAASAPRPRLVANPVSAARAGRLRGILTAIDIVYCNRAEAEALCNNALPTSEAAAEALIEMGVGRAVVTDGPGSVCDASAEGIFSAPPDPSGFASATGAGDAFLARHLAAVAKGTNAPAALDAALRPGKETA